MNRTFIREIPWELITDAVIKEYTSEDYDLVYTDDSVEVWAK